MRATCKFTEPLFITTLHRCHLPLAWLVIKSLGFRRLCACATKPKVANILLLQLLLAVVLETLDDFGNMLEPPRDLGAWLVPFLGSTKRAKTGK